MSAVHDTATIQRSAYILLGWYRLATDLGTQTAIADCKGCSCADSTPNNVAQHHRQQVCAKERAHCYWRANSNALQDRLPMVSQQESRSVGVEQLHALRSLISMSGEWQLSWIVPAYPGCSKQHVVGHKHSQVRLFAQRC